MYILCILRFLYVLECREYPEVVLVVAAEGPVVFSEIVEVGLLWPEGAVEVAEDALGGAGEGEGTVRVGRGGDAREPAIEDCEVGGQGV